MVFFERIEKEVLSGSKRIALLKPTIQNEIKKMEACSSEHNVATENFKKLFISLEFADKNNAITKEDLERILEMLS